MHAGEKLLVGDTLFNITKKCTPPPADEARVCIVSNLGRNAVQAVIIFTCSPEQIKAVELFP